MSQVLRLPAAPGLPKRPDWDARAWRDWLGERIEDQWRPGEWDPEHWLFTGDLDNPRTSSSTCRTRRCDQVVISGNTFCTLCSEHLRALPRPGSLRTTDRCANAARGAW